MESYSCTTYQEQFNAEILNDREKQEGCLQVTGDGEILRAEVQHISPKGRHTLVISSNPPMQQKAFQPWGKDNWPSQKESICLVNWREYNLGKYPPGPICRTIHKTAESARKCMAHIPGPNFIGYKPELMADNWHPAAQPTQAETTKNKGKGKRTAATQLKPFWRTNYPTYSVWDEGTPATSIPSLVKELAKSTKRPRSASQSSSSSNDNYPAMREALDKPPMEPPLSKARKAKAHFYRMKAGEGSSDLVQVHSTPGSSTVDKDSGVVEAEVSPPKQTENKTKGFSRRFLRNKPIVTREELDEGLKSSKKEVREAALKLHMLISSGNFTKAQILQEEQKFLEVHYMHMIQVTLMSRAFNRDRETTQPSLPEILTALRSNSSILRKRAINVYRIYLCMTSDEDPFFQEAAASFYRAKIDYLEATKLVKLGVLDIKKTTLDQPQEPDFKIIGTMTIDDDLFQVLDCDDPHLKACATAYYEVLSEGISLSDPRLNKVCKRFRDALENYNAKLRAQLELLQKDMSHGHSLLHKLHGCEDVQTSLSSKIQDLTLIPDQDPSKEADVGQPEVKPQGDLREQPEATPDQPAFPLLSIPGDTTDEEIPALIASGMEDFASDEQINKDNLDAPIKSESDSPVEEQITEAMVE